MQQEFFLIPVCFQVTINKADSSPAQQTEAAQQVKELLVVHSTMYHS